MLKEIRSATDSGRFSEERGYLGIMFSTCTSIVLVKDKELCLFLLPVEGILEES